MSSFGTDLRCPDDGHLLRPNDKGDVPYSVCRHCDGLWFTQEAIERKKAATLPEVTAPSRKHAPPERLRACPQCSTTLEPEHVDDVVIDVCPKCGGLWLDHGEYKAACRYRLTMRLNQRAPSLTTKTPKVVAALEQFLDKAIELHDEIFGPVSFEPVGRLTPRPKPRTH